MSDERDHSGAVARVLSEMTVGTIQAVRDRDSNRVENALREIDLQYQVQVSGSAASEPVFEEVEILFDYELHYAPAQRRSNLEEPHFTYGSHTKPAVGIHATVVKWLVNEANGAVVGAKVAIGAVGAGAFTGTVHLTFQGYGALVEEDQIPIITDG